MKNFVKLVGFFMAVIVLPVFQVYAQAKVTYIACNDLHQIMLLSKHSVIVDVRSISDYNVSHIKDAVSLPYYNTSLAAWPKDTDLVLYCSGTGCPLANNSAVLLMRAGYTSVKVLKGGMNDWELKGFPMFHSTTKTADKFACRPMQSKELYKRLSAGAKNISLLDTRPLSEFKAGHLHGSKNMPDISTNISAELAAGNEVVIVDRDVARAQKACAILTDSGVKARILSGGPAVWAALKYPLESGAGDAK